MAIAIAPLLPPELLLLQQADERGVVPTEAARALAFVGAMVIAIAPSRPPEQLLFRQADERGVVAAEASLVAIAIAPTVILAASSTFDPIHPLESAR